MKKFTRKWIKEWQPCIEAIKWFYDQEERMVVPVLEKLIQEKKYNWANWAIVRCMKRRQYLKYAIYAASRVLLIFEKKYPEDKRPRQAIQAAKRCLLKDPKQNKITADAADAAYAAHVAADAAVHAAGHAKQKMQKKILNYGIKLLSEKGN